MKYINLIRQLFLKNKITAGIILLTAGTTASLMMVVFLHFGPGWFIGPDREFEPWQEPPAVIDPGRNDSITIPGFERMTMPSGETVVPAYLYNPENNQCYFEISIILADTDDEIYQSKLVSPGQGLYEIELTQPLEQGSYDAILHYSTFALHDYKEMNGANVPIKLIVQ